RIFALRHFYYANNEIVLKQRVERMLRRLFSRTVGVETQDHFVNEAFQNPRLMFRECCPLRSDNILDSGLKKTDQIELAFADNGAIRLDKRALGFVQSKKHSSLLEQRSFGRVQIFRGLRFGFEQSPAEGDHFADVVADRENDTRTEAIENFAAGSLFVPRFHEPTLQKLRA